MDTFVESSWYYARYCSFDQEQSMLDERAKYWTPVDQYVGGIGHAVMHLLYARFMHKLLRDEGLLNSDEPFKNLLTQGMVLKDGAKMSKSKGNVVTPAPLIKKYGADTVRLFITFAAPPEQSLEWSDSGVEGSYRFLKKLWSFAEHVKPQLTEHEKTSCLLVDSDDKSIRTSYQQLHQILQKATHDIERLQLNTVVSAAMKILNILTPIKPDNTERTQLIYEGLSLLLRMLSPVTPHICHQLWIQLGYGHDILETTWPKVNPKALISNDLELMIQINGKLRGKITVPAEADQDTIEQAALADDNVQRHLGEKNIRKVIVVPKKLVNIVV